MNKTGIHALIFLSGLAALSWEVIWQIKSSLALGVSAWGTAITLAVTMGGMALGAAAMGHILRDKAQIRPVRIYGALEIVVGLAGLCLAPAFHMVEAMDAQVYRINADWAYVFHLVGIVFTLGGPALCLGATLPVIGLAAQQFRTSIALLYGLNTLGAALGALLAAFVIIPALGVTQTIWLISSINLLVGVTALIFGRAVFHTEKAQETQKQEISGMPLRPKTEFFLVFVTGFATFALEVAWFRSLTAAFLSTTVAFSLMLAAVLIALGIGARLVPLLKALKLGLGSILALSGILILVVTPVVERADLIVPFSDKNQYVLYMHWLTFTLAVIGPPMLLLGAALPWILDSQSTPRKWGFLYGFNAFSAILGSVAAGWFLLPTIGFARTSWLMGGLVALAGIAILRSQKRFVFLGACVIAVFAAVFFESGIGRKRVQITSAISSPVKEILKVYEGPDVTVSAVAHENGERTLVIDGFIATSQAEGSENQTIAEEYMDWMGHLPMLMHPEPRDALVICFGTGQTANAVRRENPEGLDIVDINKRVFQLAPYFASNEGVLDDRRVHTTIMDGRAYLRRTDKIYDVITLEPMPPTFAGVNALYSREFYKLARSRLGPDGVIAQWLPFHLLSGHLGASVAKTFQSVFPNAVLWLHPKSRTGILLGSANDATVLGHDYPGLSRARIVREIADEDIGKALLFDRDGLVRYGAYGDLITDNNQMLAYGKAADILHEDKSVLSKESYDFLRKVLREVEDGKE